MKTETYLPAYGVIGELTELTGFARKTITRALRHNSKSWQADKVRELYRTRYLKN